MPCDTDHRLDPIQDPVKILAFTTVSAPWRMEYDSRSRSSFRTPDVLPGGTLPFRGEIDGPARAVSCHALEARRLLAAVPFDAFVAPGDAALGPAVELGGFAYFFSRDTSLPAGARRVELWKTDGTPAGTVPTGVSFPAVNEWAPTQLVVFGDKLLFDAGDMALGRELWLSDGTPAGTAPATAFAALSAQPLNLTVVNDQAFFTLQEAETGRELWRTDGTPAGTRMVTDLYAGPNPSTPLNLTPFNGRVFFAAAGGPIRRSIWSSDGTAAGTERVIDLSGNSPFFLTGMHVGPTPAGPRLFLGADVFGSLVGTELWATDGTTAGTYLVKDITPGSSEPKEFTTFNDAVYFVARDNVFGPEIWRTDGTTDGTTRVTNTVPGTASIGPIRLTPVGGRLFFTGSVHASGLWSTDGTEAGTRQVAVPPRDQNFTIRDIRAVGGRAFFVPSAQTLGEEPWVSDGTDAGTFPLRDITPGPADSTPRPLTNLGGRLLFAAHEPATGAAPWLTDGTPDGTSLLRRTAGDQPVNIARLEPSGDNLYAFGTYSSAHFGAAMRGLWVSDGTVAGTRMLYARRDSFFANPEFVRPADGKIFFGGRNVWASDGTAAGTEMLHAGPIPTDPAHRSAVIEGVLYFATQASTAAPNELWKTDGTPAGTVRVKEFGATPFERGYPLGHFAPIGQRMFFRAADEQHGFEPWISDGTEAGTAMIRDVYPGNGNSTFGEYVLVAPAGGKVYFIARDGVHGSALWVSDGTADGTRFVKDLDPQATVPQLPAFAPWAADGNVLYFAAPGPFFTNAVWRTDGTEAGTRVVAGGMAAPVTDLVTWRGNLYFAFGPSTSSTNPLVPGTLYRSNGMPGNATPLRAFLTVTPLDAPQNLVAAPDGVYFHARDATANRSLWRTNGTPAGTVAVHTPAQSPDMTPPVPFKGRVWFAERGRPWVVDPPPPVAGRHVFYNNSVADGRDPAANFVDDAAIDHAKRALLPGGRATFANLTSYHRGINGVMVDLSNVPAAAVLSADDFELHTGNGTTWTPLSTAPGVALRRAAGVAGTDRVTLTLPEGLVKNAWLRVTVRATADTGLSAPDVFYFGNLVGDVGTDGASTAVVDRIDLARVRARRGLTSDATRALFDVNRDGFVSMADYTIVRANQGRRLAFFTATA